MSGPVDLGAGGPAPLQRERGPSGPAHPVLLYDGLCPLCDDIVRTVLAHDRRDTFRFAALHSQAAGELLAAARFTGERPDSVVLVEGPRLWWRSGVVVRVLVRLGFPWTLLAGLLWLVPRPVREALYIMGGEPPPPLVRPPRAVPHSLARAARPVPGRG